ncbi:hypothetical protein SPF06_19950 [Sinomonas sp. JGH33]|uniref:DUF6993 domain-containing protein n=1 Tax=Sinomonas terricola TaxID=3110330 RepID=A0ABU5TBE3_9MICC|nr:hypothetical protein [Sinomonas sp. JGH33]MEA5457003.1 hypothetical protein [Sinomonas sp. JGH33]
MSEAKTNELTKDDDEATARAEVAARRRPGRVAAGVALVVAALVVAVAALLTTSGGWRAFLPHPAAPSAAASPNAATPSPAPTRPLLARFDPLASDGDNLQLFGSVLTRAAQSTSSSSVTAKTLTDALVAVGFSPASMQRTADQTSANLQAPTLTVSVKYGGGCLIGQFVRSEASVSTELAAPIGTGACLVGETAPVG